MHEHLAQGFAAKSIVSIVDSEIDTFAIANKSNIDRTSIDILSNSLSNIDSVSIIAIVDTV